MLSQPFKTLSSISLLLTFLNNAVMAQSKLSIVNITTSGVFDLAKMSGDLLTTDTADVSWEIEDEKSNFIGDDVSGRHNVELMRGPSDENTFDVMDIAMVDGAQSESKRNYYIPASIPLGLYHWRCNSSLSQSHDFEAANLTARSPTFNVTSSKPASCPGDKPPPYTPITSPTSPSYTSLYLVAPRGHATLLGALNGYQTEADDAFSIAWSYRDAFNIDLAASISNLTMQVIDSATSSPVGPPLVETEDGWDNLIAVNISEVPVKVGKTYKAVAKYLNSGLDGTVAPGNFVTYTSQEFSFVAHGSSGAACSSAGSDSSKGEPNGAEEMFRGLYYLFFCAGVLAYLV